MTDRSAGVDLPTNPLARILRDSRLRSVFIQIVTVGLVVGLFAYLASNTSANMAERNLSAGFDFLDVTAGFGIGFSLIEYKEGDSYGRVFLVGLMNTLLVAVVSIAFASVLGFFIGLGRLSQNWLISRVARAYVELLRNTPLLLQIVGWYLGVFTLLPRPRDSFVLSEVFVLNNRGFYMPSPVPEAGFNVVMWVLLACVIFAIGLARWARRRQDLTGQPFPALPVGFATIIGLPLILFLALGTPLSWDIPELTGFNYVGGVSVPPSFCALIVALSAYTASFIAEIVRAGIQSVSKGQLEAAGALNLPSNWTLRRVVLPQAMRVIIPPLISQYLNVTKNSSLAIAVGYPDLVSVWMNTTLNQSGRAIPVVVMTMAFYCAVSLTVSIIMNQYNKRVLIKER
ncbi:MAG: amino acid ABC transporter permease [Pseudomonadota bacterium]